MNSDNIPNDFRPKKDYPQMQQSLKSRCDEISKDNDALSSRLISLKLLVYKTENQCRQLKKKLEMLGIDYQAAAMAAASASPEESEFSTEKVKPHMKMSKKKRLKVSDLNQSPTSSKFSVNPVHEPDPGLSNPFSEENII